MRVTAWNNGKHHRSGAGYGLKISAADRDRHFKKTWASVVVELPNGVKAIINTDKQSFWSEACRELISKEIGAWLRLSGLAPWPSGAPPAFGLDPTDERHFVLKQSET